jgi:glycosyltransferase involved in cell wall biosynthesis
MRILMVTDFYQPYVGGVEIVVQSLAHELSGRGHNVSVATIRGDGSPAYEEDGPVRIHRLRCSAARLNALFGQRRTWAPPVPDPEATVGLRRIAAIERPQIVHGHDWLARSFLPLAPMSDARFVMSLHYYTVSCAKKSLMYRGAPCTGPAPMKCMRCGSSHYGAAKGSAVVLGNFLFAAAERRTVDLFLPVSEATAVGNGLLGSGLPYEVIPNFVSESRPLDSSAQHLLKALPEGDFLLYVGDVRKEKGVDVLLDAFRDLAGAPPLVLLGKSWPDWSPELPPNVLLLTDWPNAAVREAQRRCLALVAPSVWPEPFGMVIIETFASGRPVIASRVGGMAKLVEEGVSGLLVPPGDAAMLRAAMASMLNDDRLVARLAEQASRSAMRFRAVEIVPRFERAYARTLDGPGESRADSFEQDENRSQLE